MGGSELCQTKGLTIGVLEGSDVLAKQLLCVRTVQSNELAVAVIRTKWIKVPVQESALSPVEHIERFGLVCLHGGKSFQEHCLCLVGGSEVTLILRESC